jgi:ABC-type nitrate/sulfonate/bicarbonate transport system ATPase subunit
VAAVRAELAVDIQGKDFTAPDGEPRPVLRDVAFRVRPGEFVALLGPSGCGKTTLLNLVAGLDTQFVGSVYVDCTPPASLRIGYVFQQPRLLPWRTVFENIALVLPRDADAASIRALLDEVGLAGAHDVYPHRLSLGMARRAAIARAFAIRPELLLMDEPFVSLDAAAADRLRQVLVDLWRSHPTTVLFVTHDLEEAVMLADRILILSDAPGRLLADVPVTLPRAQRPDRALLDAFRNDLAERQRRLLAGAAPSRDQSEGSPLTSASRDRR